jgi:hypothetical protein
MLLLANPSQAEVAVGVGTEKTHIEEQILKGAM